MGLGLGLYIPIYCQFKHVDVLLGYRTNQLGKKFPSSAAESSQRFTSSIVLAGPYGCVHKLGGLFGGSPYIKSPTIWSLG